MSQVLQFAAMEVESDTEFRESNFPTAVIEVPRGAKLKEILRNVTSFDLKFCSDASKEFIKLLKTDAGGEFLREYVKSSSNCAELLQAWKLRRGKSGLLYIFRLVASILSHPVGKYKANSVEDIGLSRALDKFARLIIEEKLGDVYEELNSKEVKRQNAALLVLGSVVRRGSVLASEVAKSFDFKLPIFPKLAEYNVRRGVESKRKHSTRRAFVGFAMSFLEVGKPGLLRWVLQQRDMFSVVLRGLGSDDDETVCYVLSTLRDRILVPESLVPPGLRSVIFGSVTLDQLISIAGRENGGLGTEVAFKVLGMVCTDPSNGLMPDPKRHPNPLRGNQKRLLDLMKKLKATEIRYHRELLLSIVNGSALFGSAYLDEFPYNLEDHASPTWFAAVSLAANLVSSVRAGYPFGFLENQTEEPPSINSSDVQGIIRCISPRPFSRLVINKGLLHSDSVVKQGTLRLVLEALMLLDSFIGILNNCARSSSQMSHIWASLKQDIQNEIRILLPDPQVLLSLLSPLNLRYKSPNSRLKRVAASEIVLEENMNRTKKKRTHSENEATDIVVCGITSSPDVPLPGDGIGVQENAGDLEIKDDCVKAYLELWGLHQCMAVEDEETYFYSKLLDTLKIYHRTMPTVLEGSFDFFKVLPSNPLGLPTILQQSLLSLLMEHIEWSSTRKISIRTQPLMYRHLHAFIELLMYSQIRDIKDQAYILAEAAMLSTGAFETNSREIGAWFLFLPGYSSCNNIVEHGVEIIQNLSSVVVSFLCDAVSTTGNNLFKYWDLLRCHIHRLEGDEDVSPDFSPLMVCVLEKCLRLLSSDSGTFTLPEKAMISLYVSNTLRYILQTQVEAGLLSSLISLLLSEGLDGHCSSIDIHGDFCEWRPLENLLLFSNSILDKQTCSILSDDTKVVHADSSFYHTLSEVKNFVGRGYDDILPGITTAFVYSMLCTEPAAIAKNFPSVVSISHSFHGVPIPHLFSIVSLEQNLLKDVSKLWPGMFFTGVERVVTMIHGEGRVEELTVKLDMDSIGSATVAFCSFLERAPFYVLFPALLSVGYSYVLEISKLQDLLLTKLSEEATDLISSLRLLLFWFYKIESSYRDKPLDELEQLSEMCFTLMDKMLGRLFVEKTDSGFSTITSAPLSTHYLQEVAETIFCHPAVIMTLECPLSRSEEFSDAILGESWENFLALARRGVHKNDYCVFDMLAKTSDYVFALCNDHKIPSEVDCANKRIVKAFESLVQKLFGILKERFDHCTNTNLFLPLIPTLFALYTLSRFISPFELLELVQWIFSKADLKDSTSNYSALAIGLGIAGCAFDLLSAYVQQPGTELTAFVSWGIEGKSFDVTLFENIYFRVADIASRVELDVADICFLKVVNGFSRHRLLQNKCLPLCVVMSRLIASTPVRFLSHCLQRTSITKALLIFRLTEVSPLHLAIFGHLFSDMTSGTFLRKCNMVQGYTSTLADDDFLLLLPTALSYLKSNLVKYGKQFYNCFRKIPSFYWTILVHGFSNWKSFVSREIFRVEFNEYLLSSEEELLNFFHRSLLGTSILMARYYFALCGGSWKQKKRLKLFDSVCSSSGVNEDLLDCDVGNISAYSPNHCLNFTMKALAKISLCRMLLFPEDNLIQFLPKDGNGDPVGVTSEIGSCKAFSSRTRFVEALVHTWQSVVKKVPSNPFGSRKVECTNYSLFRYLEVFILRNISEITAEMHDSGMQSDSLPYIEQLARYTLLYRFEVPGILSMLCNVLALVPEGTFSHSLVLQLLIAHSQFAPTIQSASCSSGSLQFGMIFKPMSSILKSLVLHGKDDYALCKEDNPQMPKQLEVVKLLRVLFHFTAQQCGFDSEEDNGINCKELLFLLMSSYGATMSEIDVEISYLMHEIECISESNPAYVAEIDYLWGSAAVKVRKEREMEQDISVDNTNDETVEERRRIQFRENLPVDPKMCANTVLHFPYYRTTGEGFLSSNKLPRGDAECMTKVCSANLGRIQIYDPIFILRFSSHSLSMGYLEPKEFASLGLLAVAFVSISSPDVETRKLSYDTLGRFKSALEKCQKRKDVTRLRLLLTYLQNGIEEPWQKIPSISALFVAEASFILLDPSHDHYMTISKLLVRSPRMNMKSIPMFHEFFWSSSVDFKTERLWILRLLYAGLNLDDDAHIYIRNSVFEILLSFYASPLSDNESKELILQTVRKSIKLHKMALYLVEHCGLISWLSSVVSSFCGRKHQYERSFSSTQLNVVLEVVNYVISSRHTSEWLQKCALEQLTELSSHLYKFLAGGMKLIKEVPLVNSIIAILTSTLKISLEREVFQPHFTLSVEGLYQICQVIDVCSDGTYCPDAALGLKAVLMSTPPAVIFCMDREKLLKFILWATSTALRSNSTKVSYHHFTLLEEEQSEDSLISKLLRWLTASVILGQLPRKLNRLDSNCSLERVSAKTLCSLLHLNERWSVEKRVGFGSVKILADTIFYLHQLLGWNYRMLPSVISALCLLLLSDPSFSESNIGHGNLASLISRIRCPAEANPAWRWSYYQPWKDHSCELTDAGKLDEIQACQSLLLIISDILGKNSLHLPLLSYHDVESSGVFEWERSILETEC